MQTLPSLPHYLLRNAESRGSRVAMRHKDLGIWREWTWREMLEEIQAFSLGLLELGLAPGDRVAIVGANRPRLYWTFAAVQAALYDLGEATPEQVARQFARGRANTVQPLLESLTALGQARITEGGQFAV